jgi:hypothetical protein
MDRGATLGGVFNTLLAYRNLKTKTTGDYHNTVNICFGDWIDQPITIISRQCIEDRFPRICRGRGDAQAAKAFRILSTIPVDGRVIGENACFYYTNNYLCSVGSKIS